MRVNHAKSRIRARIEHVFGAQQNAPGGRIVRTIGIVRARAKIGLQNLAYNIRPRRGMKTVELSAVFQPKRWRKKKPRKTTENRT